MPIPRIATDDASAIALKFLSYVVADAAALERLTSLTGLDATTFRARAADADFHGALLDYALQDESLLFAFATEIGLSPHEVTAARRALPGASGDL